MTPKALLAPARLARQPVLRSQSDERLVDLVRAGSEPAFEVIVARYRGALLRYCRGILPESRAEDAVQQAFVSAFAAMRRDDAYIDLRPWLYRIAHNTALNGLRDRSLRHAELDEGMDGVERPDQAMERRQGLREVLARVTALPARQRDAMVLRELEGRSYEEIAGELGVSGGAVRQLLNRARTTLRAGITAVTPPPLALRLCSGDGEPTAVRVGELVTAGGAGALAIKVAATALVTGVVAGGVATVPDRGDEPAKAAQGPATAAESQRPGAEATEQEDLGDPRGGEADGQGADDRRGDRRGRGDDDGVDHSGPGSGEPGDDGGVDHSGPGGGGTSDDDGGHSGPGSSGSGSSSSASSGSGSSGSGSFATSGSGSFATSGSGSSGSGSSGSGSSGSGISGSGISGSGISGSGSSGSGISGSGSSGSGSSGSGTSGSGSSGSGSGDPTVVR